MHSLFSKLVSLFLNKHCALARNLYCGFKERAKGYSIQPTLQKFGEKANNALLINQISFFNKNLRVQSRSAISQLPPGYTLIQATNSTASSYHTFIFLLACVDHLNI